MTKSSGTFSSPGYPSAYPRDTLCEWYIRTAPGTRVQVTINDMDIESVRGCRFDALHVSSHHISMWGCDVCVSGCLGEKKVI